MFRSLALIAPFLWVPCALAQTPCPTQSTPNFTAGGNVFGRTAPQWNAYFGAKLDNNGGTACNLQFLGIVNLSNSTVVLPSVAGATTTTIDILGNGGTVPAGPSDVRLKWGSGLTQACVSGVPPICTITGSGGSGTGPVAGVYDTAQYGDTGDGSTSSSAAIQSALNTAGAAGGGIVMVKPTGASHVITTGLQVPAGVHLTGTGGLYWTSPIDNNRIDWTSHGSWLWCQDTTNPCVTVNGNGASVEGLNYWYTQPTPTPTNCGSPCTYVSYTYTTYPYTILVANTASVGVWIKDNNIVNASHCLDWEGPSAGLTGIYSGISRNSFGCLKRAMLLHWVDNTLTIDHNRVETWWYQGTAQIWWAMQSAANGFVAVDTQYLANAQFIGNEFSFLGTAFQFTDATVTSGFGPITLAAGSLQGSSNSFNEVCTAMAVANATTHVSGTFYNTTLYADSATSPVAGQCAQAQPYAIDMASDNVDFTLNGVHGGVLQSLAFIGGGASGAVHGQLHLKNVEVQSFSSFAAGANAMATDSTGSELDLSGSTPFVYPSSAFTAGTICSGAGCGSIATFALGSLEIGGAATTTRQLIFSQTVAANPFASTIGRETWAWRADGVNNNLNLDRSATPGTFTDSPIVINRLTGNINLNDQFFLAQTTVAGLASAPYNGCTGGNDIGASVLVTDQAAALSPGSNVSAGGGGVRVLAICSGTAWIQH